MNRFISFVLFFIFTFLAKGNLLAYEKSVECPEKTISYATNESGKTYDIYKRSIALLISASEYTGTEAGGFSRLENNFLEMNLIKKSLLLDGFCVTTAINPKTNQDIQKIINEFLRENGYREKTRFLFMFSGHGFTDEKRNVYIVPTDATNPIYSPGDYIELYSLMFLMDQLKKINAVHAAFIFDSCFAGTLFNNKGGVNYQQINKNMLEENARKETIQAFTAGGYNEIVPGKSIFSEALYNEISKGNLRFFSDISKAVTMAVTAKSKNHPTFGYINISTGDIIFGLQLRKEISSDMNTVNYSLMPEIFRVFFENDRPNISELYKSQIKYYLENIASLEDKRIFITGHCANDFLIEEGNLISSTSSHALSVAYRRANSVANYIIYSLNVPSEKIFVTAKCNDYKYETPETIEDLYRKMEDSAKERFVEVEIVKY